MHFWQNRQNLPPKETNLLKFQKRFWTFIHIFKMFPTLITFLWHLECDFGNPVEQSLSKVWKFLSTLHRVNETQFSSQYIYFASKCSSATENAVLTILPNFLSTLWKSDAIVRKQFNFWKSFLWRYFSGNQESVSKNRPKTFCSESEKNVWELENMSKHLIFLKMFP